MNILKKYWGILRRLRVLHFLLNAYNYNKLSRNKFFYKTYGVKKSILGSISHKDILVKKEDIPWLDKENYMNNLKKKSFFQKSDVETQQQLLHWNEKGYLILKNYIPDEIIDKINSELNDLVNSEKVDFDYTNTRVMNAYRYSPTIRQTVKDEKLLELMEFILGKKALLFQTISFIKGSQTPTHSDSIHMTTEPPGYLIAIWIALEDVKPGCGPLHYFPGSHKLPYIMSEDFETGNTPVAVGDNYYENYLEKIDSLIKKEQFRKEEFYAKKGDLLIWHANLLHGGSKVTDEKLSRRSLVAHYFADGVLCYHEITQRPAIVENV